MLALAASETTDRAAPGVRVGAPGGDAIDAARRQGRRRGDCQSSTYHPDGSMVAVDRARGAARCRPHRSGERRRAGRRGDRHARAWRSGLRSGRRRAGRGLRAAPPVHPRSGASRFPAAAPRERSRDRPAPTSSSRTTRTDAGSERCGRTTTGREREIVVWAVDSPDAPISLGPGTSYGFLPGTTSVVIAGGDDQGSLTVVDIETGDVVRSIETPDIEVDSDRRRSDRRTAWRCVSTQQTGSWSSISTAASGRRLRRHRLAVGRVQP